MDKRIANKPNVDKESDANSAKKLKRFNNQIDRSSINRIRKRKEEIELKHPGATRFYSFGDDIEIIKHY